MGEHAVEEQKGHCAQSQQRYEEVRCVIGEDDLQMVGIIGAGKEDAREDDN